MISASEARHTVKLQTISDKHLTRIDEGIRAAIENNHMSTSIPFSDNLSSEVLDVLMTELANLGYKVEYKPSEPCPPAYPSDKWDFYSYLTVSWEED